MVKVTNADRVVFPQTGTTKGDVVTYYESIAPRMLPHLAERPLTLRRYPRGVGAPGFFQKNVPDHYPDTMARVEIPKSDGVTIHPCASEAEHLAFMANQGVIELHVPCVRGGDLFHPDRFILDLDPPEGSVDLVRRAALVVRDELAALGLQTVPVATGSKGYHLVAPIQPVLDAHALVTVAHQLGALLAERHPDLLTMTFRVAKRGARVFLDWMRNAVPSTVVAPYSIRARKAPTVATPITWEELPTTPPDAFTIETVRQRDTDPLLEAARSPHDPRPFANAVSAAFATSGLELESFDRFRS